MIKQLSKLDKVINFQHKSLIKKLSQKQIKLYTLIDKYLDEYARFHKMNVKKVVD